MLDNQDTSLEKSLQDLKELQGTSLENRDYVDMWAPAYDILPTASSRTH